MLRKVRLIPAILLLAVFALAQGVPVPAEAGNNTSAVRGQSQAGNANPAAVSKLPIRSLLYPGATTKIFVRWMPWFGDEHHMDVGYNSDDPGQIAKQVDDMKSRGIDGAVVDWYGPGQTFKNRATERLLATAEKRGFSVAISEDSGALKDCAAGKCDTSSKLISDLTYVIDHFAQSPAYVRFNNRPLITFFGLEKYDIDWHKVRKRVPGNPLFIFRNSGGFQQPEGDGAYSWIAPETASPADPMALRYLERFYEKATQNSDKFAMGSAYKGFNDTLAGWGKGRIIDQRCGQTWLETFAVANARYSSRHQLAALIIPTWNDYEEGTEIETGIDNCVRINARLNGKNLQWELDGPASTVDHFTVHAYARGQSVNTVDAPQNAHLLPLDSLRLPQGVYELRVEAVGKPSILNQFSNPVAYAIANRKTSDLNQELSPVPAPKAYSDDSSRPPR